MSAAVPWMQLATKELGVHEFRGSNNNNPRIIEYYKDSKAGVGVSADEVPWCSAFACAMLERSGVKSWRSLASVDAIDWGRSLPKDSPIYGAIVQTYRGNDLSLGHVTFFVEKLDNGNWKCRGGNQRDSVCDTEINPEKVRAVRWPILERAPKSKPVAEQQPISESPPEPPLVPAIVAPARVSVDVEQHLRERGSRTIQSADNAERWTVRGVLSICGLGASKELFQFTASLKDALGDLRPVIDGTSELLVWAYGKVWILTAFLLAAVLVELIKIRRARVDDHVTGVHTGRH